MMLSMTSDVKVFMQSRRWILAFAWPYVITPSGKDQQVNALDDEIVRQIGVSFANSSILSQISLFIWANEKSD